MPLEPVGSGVTSILLNGAEEFTGEQTGDAEYNVQTQTNVNHPTDSLGVNTSGSTGYGGAVTIFNTGSLGLPEHSVGISIDCSGPDGGFEIKYSGVGSVDQSSLQPGESAHISGGPGTGGEYLRIVADGSFDMGYDVFGSIDFNVEPSVDTYVTDVTKTE